MLFKDRLEIWNPGSLPYGLTTAKLRKPHSSIPANPLLAEPMYLAGFIERMGTRTGDIIRLCEEAGLKKAPDFLQEEIFKTILWRKNKEKLAGDTPGVGVNVGVNAVLMLIEKNRLPLIANNQRLKAKGQKLVSDLHLMTKGVYLKEGGYTVENYFE